jgi:hypothetical protein
VLGREPGEVLALESLQHPTLLDPVGVPRRPGKRRPSTSLRIRPCLSSGPGTAGRAVARSPNSRRRALDVGSRRPDARPPARTGCGDGHRGAPGYGRRSISKACSCASRNCGSVSLRRARRNSAARTRA